MAAYLYMQLVYLYIDGRSISLSYFSTYEDPADDSTLTNRQVLS